MRKIIYSLLLALMVSPALAANLVFVTNVNYGNPPDRYYVDMDSVKRKGDIVSVRALMVFAKPYMDGAAGPITQNISINEINCKAHTIAVPAVYAYGAGQRLVKRYDATADFYPLQGPDEIMASKVCH